jgi:hypothetical protein
MALAALSLLLGALAWDQRSDWEKFLDGGMSAEHPFKAWIQPRQQVMWEGPALGALATWTLLDRPSFYSVIQGAGTVFSRAKALAFKPRYEVLKRHWKEEVICAALDLNHISVRECLPPLADLMGICREAPGLDFMILGVEHPGFYVSHWQFQGPHSSRPWYLYSCAKLRSVPEPATAPP